MKCLFWNNRGLTNQPSKLDLKNFIISNKLDIVIVIEHWMSFQDFPSRWLERLGLKLFSLNIRDSLNPNI